MKTPEAKAAEEADRVQLVEALAEHPGTPWGEAIGKVAALRIEHDTLLRGVAHPMWLPSVADAIGMDEPFQATSTDVLAMVRARMEERDKAQADLADGRIGNAAWGAFIDELRASLATVTRERDEAWRQRDSHARFLYSQGYTPCGIAACNCNSWHGGHVEGLRARLRHVPQMLIEATGAGGPMDAEAAAEKAVVAIMERDELRAALETYRAALSARAAARQAVADWMDAEAHEMRLRTAKEAPGWAAYEASERALSEATAALARGKP